MNLFILLVIIFALALIGMTIYNLSGGSPRRTVVYRDRPAVDEVIDDEVEVVERPRRRIVRRY